MTQSIESMIEVLAKQIDQQAKQGDTVCQDYIAEQAMNEKRGNGFSLIETQLCMEDENDDFKPY